jgi:aldehyde:ferredoxin oxidoreductase
MQGSDLEIAESDLAFMVRDYYRLRGWDETGVPNGPIPV